MGGPRCCTGPTSTVGGGSWGGWRNGGLQGVAQLGRKRKASGLSQDPVPSEPHGTHTGLQPLGMSPLWVSAARIVGPRARGGSDITPPPSHSTHQGEQQGAGSPWPRPMGRRRRRRGGQRTGRTAGEPAGTCPSYVPVLSHHLQGLAAEKHSREQTPPAPRLPSPRPDLWQEGGGTADGGRAPWQRVPWQSHPAPSEHPRGDGSGGSRQGPGPPSKPASWGGAARGGSSPPRRDSPG